MRKMNFLKKTKVLIRNLAPQAFWHVTACRHAFLSFSLVLMLLTSCSGMEESEQRDIRKINAKGEFIYRKQNDQPIVITPPRQQKKEPYPWNLGVVGNYPRITKDFLRCKGGPINPIRIEPSSNPEKEASRYTDCGGAEKHGLPLRGGKEFIYPVLLDLLNYIQAQSGKRVVVTSGHRCPPHNLYVDSSPKNQGSKHQMGAEVDFYVQGMELQPEAIVSLIAKFYKETPRYKGKADFQHLARYEKSDTNVSTPPWQNKEIFIKLFKKEEGRNFDNRHPYPYINIQVRWDQDTNEKVVLTNAALHNYLRW